MNESLHVYVVACNWPLVADVKGNSKQGSPGFKAWSLTAAATYGGHQEIMFFLFFVATTTTTTTHTGPIYLKRGKNVSASFK